MIEQINIALEQKGPGISQRLGHWSLPSETFDREAYIELKVMKGVHDSSSGQDDIVNSLNYGGIAVIDLRISTFLTVTDCVLALSWTK